MRNEHNPSDQRESYSLKNKVLALVGAGAVLASLSACGPEKAKAEPTSSETTTSVETETPEPTTDATDTQTTEPTIETPTPSETVTEMPEIPTFRPDGQPWEGVDETYADLMEITENAKNGDYGEGGEEVVAPYYKMLAINEFIEQNTGLDLYGTDKDGMVDYLNAMQNMDNEEVLMGIAERDQVSRDLMERLYVHSEAGSPEEAIALTWAENYVVVPEWAEDKSYLFAGSSYGREGVHSSDPEAAIDAITTFESPQKVVGISSLEVVGGAEHNDLIMKYVTFNPSFYDDNAPVDTGAFRIDEIGIGPNTNETELREYSVSKDDFDITQFPEVNDLLDMTVGEAKEAIGQQN